MANRQPVVSEKGLKSPLFSQAMIHGNTVFVSGNIGIVPATNKVVEGSVADRTRQALINIQNVLEEAGSNLQKMLKVRTARTGTLLQADKAQCNIYLTNMQDYAAMNKVCRCCLLSSCTSADSY